MELALVLLPALAVVGLVAALLVRQRRRTRALTEAVAARGWRYRPLPRGFAVEGGEALPWTLTVRKARSSTQNHAGGGGSSTIWEAPVEPADAVVFAGPKVPAMVASLDLGGGLVQMLLRAVLGDEAADLADAEFVEHGTPAFRQRFSVVTSDPDLAASVLDEETQQLLLAGPKEVTLLRWRDRLQVRLPRGLYDAEPLAELVALGEALTR